jgi:hypothetical protein
MAISYRSRQAPCAGNPALLGFNPVSYVGFRQLLGLDGKTGLTPTGQDANEATEYYFGCAASTLQRGTLNDYWHELHKSAKVTDSKAASAVNLHCHP